MATSNENTPSGQAWMKLSKAMQNLSQMISRDGRYDVVTSRQHGHSLDLLYNDVVHGAATCRLTLNPSDGSVAVAIGERAFIALTPLEEPSRADEIYQDGQGRPLSFSNLQMMIGNQLSSSASKH